MENTTNTGDLKLLILMNRLDKMEAALEKLHGGSSQRLPISRVCQKFRTSPATVRRYLKAGYVQNVGQPGKALILDSDAAKCWERK